MIRQAKVASIEALEDFRAALCAYLDKARPALENMCDDVRQTRAWLESERKTHWEHAVRLRARALSEAQQELFSAKLSNLKAPSSAQQRAVTHAKFMLTEAEDKLRLTRRWIRDFENLTLPHIKEIEQSHTFLTVDMRRSLDFLAAMIDRLEKYAELAPPPSFGAAVTAQGNAGVPGAGDSPAFLAEKTVKEGEA